MQIIVPHTNTDFDALGAAVGAQALYPHALIVLPGPMGPSAEAFCSLHKYNLRLRTARDISLEAVTRLIVVDTADPRRLGPLESAALRCEVHLYDHHPPEPGDLNAVLEVREQVGATCTLIAELIEEAGAQITPVQATAMLLGIHADTGSLTYTGTTERDARAAGFLLARGASLRAMGQFLSQGLTAEQEALLVQLQERSRLIEVQGTRIRLALGETPGYVGGLNRLVHELLQADHSHALFAAVHMEDRVHLVGRSDVPWVDAGRVAASFGGSGHAGAASAVVRGKGVEEVAVGLEQLLAEVAGPPRLARDIMSTPVRTVLPDIRLPKALSIMQTHGHSGLPVVNEEGKMVGIISLNQVERALQKGQHRAPVRSIMVRNVVTVTPDTPVERIQELMIERDIGRLPVMEGERLFGIVSRADMLDLIYGGPAPSWHRKLYLRPLRSSANGLARVPQEQDARDQAVHNGVQRLSEQVQDLLRTAGAVAHAEGVPAFVVGGFVRDLLLGRANLDIDVVVEGDGLAYARALSRRLGGRVEEVPRFGTAHVYLPARTGRGQPGPCRVDVATARREWYEYPAALPQVENAFLRDDLSRRDFSMNAMACRLGPDGPMGLIDLFGGYADLESGVLRVLHTLSFVEDPTRIVRAVRFAHRYGFRLDPESLELAKSALAQGLLHKVSAERRRNELSLLLREERPGKAVARLLELGALRQVLGTPLPEDMEVNVVDRFDDLAATWPDLANRCEPWVARLLFLLHLLPDGIGLQVVRRMRLRREHEQTLAQVLRDWRTALDALGAAPASVSLQYRVLCQLPPEGLMLLGCRGAAQPVAAYWMQWQHMRLSITGEDLVQGGIAEGPAIGRALEQTFRDHLDGLAPDRGAQLARALRYASEEA